MKTVINSIKSMVITIVAVFSLSFTTATIPTNDSITKADAELKFLGKEANQPLFCLQFNTVQLRNS